MAPVSIVLLATMATLISGCGPVQVAQKSAEQAAATTAAKPPVKPPAKPGDSTATDPPTSAARTPTESPLPLRDFRPASMLKVATTEVGRARFPVVDVHTHFGLRFRGSAQSRDDYVRLMDRNRIAACVSLDGKLGDKWQDHRDYLWTDHQDRFVIFVHIDWQGRGKKDQPETWACQRPEFGRQIARQLAEAKSRGASGLKIFKALGLYYPDVPRRDAGTNNRGEPRKPLLRIDDERWDPIWQACGELGMPVIIHTADPAAFFLPIDRTNERYEELERRPQWSFYQPGMPSRDELLAARNRVIERHSSTQFIGAHLANNAEDVATVSQWLEKYPNLHVEFASRIGELGRQPFTAREFLIRHADRVLFGTDGPWPEIRVRLYWRFLETRDEYFPYSEKPFPPQGLWNIYGVDLPDDVLRKIYHENAAKLIPGVAERLAKWAQNPPASAVGQRTASPTSDDAQ